MPELAFNEQINNALLGDPIALKHLTSSKKILKENWRKIVPKLLNEADKQQNKQALFLLGFIYQYGIMGLTDISDAIRYYKKAINFGQVDAMFHCAYLYYSYANQYRHFYPKALEFYQMAYETAA